MSAKVAVNGRFLTRQVTGVDRYARELLTQLDKLVEPGAMAVVVPEACDLVQPISFDNIDLVRYGRHQGHFWEQFDFSRYLSKSGCEGVSLCNTAPLFNPGVVCIHDMAVRANPQNYSWKFTAWYRLLYRFIVRRARSVITVSDFSKREIEKYYPEASGKISIVPNAWQHVERVIADDNCLKREGLTEGSFWFAMSSLAPNKNLGWLVETAKLNPEETVVIAGGFNGKVFASEAIPKADNVKYVGYVSDAESKALLEGCKGFLFPTFYEGFGIPPMEALACGALAVVSDTEVMHEVYSDSVVYIDPAEPCVDLNACLRGEGTEGGILGKYSWKRSAEKLLEIICSDF